MSIASIHYWSIGQAANEAKSVAKKLDKYASALEKRVYKKLSDYDGKRNDNITTAQSKVSAKINALENEAEAYRTYESDLDDLKEKCGDVDKGVKDKVSKLTSTFKKNNGIRDSQVENWFGYHCAAAGNKLALGRIVGDSLDDAGQKGREICNAIEKWYDYEGGKQAVKGMAIALLEGIVAVCAIAASIAALIAASTVFAAIAAVAGIIGGAIALGNAFCNFNNETQAYDARQNGDPAYGYRRSKLDTMTETMRTDSDEKWVHNLAFGIDLTKFACDVINIIKGGTDFVNAFKTGGGLGDFFASLKGGDKSKALQSLKDWAGMFGRNMKNEFWNFTGDNKLKTVQNTFSTLKNLFSLPLDTLKDGFGVTALKTITVGFTMFNGSDEGDHYTFGKFNSFGDKLVKIFDPTLGKEGAIDIKVIEKIDIKIDVDIAVPIISMPNMAVQFAV